MKQIKLFLVILFLLFVLSCTINNKSGNYEREKVVFDVGFNISSRFSGMFHDKTAKKDFVFFADPTTKKKLKIFNSEGGVVSSIDLTELVNTLGEVNDIAIYSPDTIIANSLYTNKLGFINREGKVWKYIDLNKYTIHDGGVYRFTSSSISDFKLGKSLLFNCERRMELKDTIPNKEESGYAAYKKFYENSFKADYFFKLDNIFNNIQPNYGLKSFYSNLNEKPQEFTELANYTYVNGHVFVASIYADKIFVVDKNTLNIEKIITLHSENTKIGIEPTPLSEDNFNNSQKIMNQKARSVGFISDIFFNKSTKHYNVVLYHENTDMEIRLAERPFSIIVLDEEMKQIDEVLFEDLQNYGDFSIMTDKGLMFYSNTNSNNPKEHEKEFYVYNF